MTPTERSPITSTPVVVAGLGILLTLGLALTGTMAPDLAVRVALVGGVVAALVAMASTSVAHRVRADALKAELAAVQSGEGAGRDRAATLAESRRQLVAWVADDLQTPLARLQATAEALEEGVIDQPIEVAAALAVMSQEIKGVAGLVGDLHELTEAPRRSGGPAHPGISTFDVVFRTVPVRPPSSPPVPVGNGPIR